MFVDDNIFNSPEASRFCHAKLVIDSEGKFLRPFSNFSWLPSLERQFNSIVMYLPTVTFSRFLIVATVVSIKLRHVLYVDPIKCC